MNFVEQSEVKNEFSWVSVVSELGGILYLLYLAGSFIAWPLAEFTFKIDAIREY